MPVDTAIRLLSVNDLLSVRVLDHATEFASRVEDVDGESVLVAAPMGSSATLLESGYRAVEITWMSPRGCYKQHAELVEFIPSPLKLWRLVPDGEAELEQRRRYARVSANLAVVVDFDDDGNEGAVKGTTVDVAEGGIRVLLPRPPVDSGAAVGVTMTVGDDILHLDGHVLRCRELRHDRTEMVITFPARGRPADVLRRFVFLTQIRHRALKRDDL